MKKKAAPARGRAKPAARVAKPARKTAKKPVRPVKKVAAKAKPAPRKLIAPARKETPKKTSGRPSAVGENHGAFDFELEPPMVDLSIERHVVPPPPPVPKKRRGSHVDQADYPGDSLTVGMEAPEFSLPSTLGRNVTLSEFRGKRVVLYFYPKDDTPGCTMEACAFRDSLPRIEAKGSVVLGISLDDEISHQRFMQKYNLNFPLLADKDAAISRKYGTYKEKTLYGRNFWGIERTTFVIDKDGKVEHVFRRVKVEGHAEEVMATLAG
jgi:peroxiredoxin Q/BCP